MGPVSISSNISSSNMRRFVISLISLCLLLAAFIVAMHAVKIWSMREEIDRAFTLDEKKDVLFVGSSQMGCSIDDSPCFHNQKSWISDTIAQSFLMRMKELERRGELKKVKVCVAPFHVFLITSQSKNGFMWAWYQEIAVSWRYLDMLPFGKLEFFRYIACNLRFPFMIHVQDTPPKRTGLNDRPAQFLKKFYESNDGWASGLNEVKGAYPGWEENFLSTYREMKQICDRHQIRFVVYRAPVLPRFDHLIPESGQAQIHSWEERLKEAGIEYVDTIHEIPEKYFFDSIHLIPEGARIFTEDLYRRMGVEFKPESR